MRSFLEVSGLCSKSLFAVIEGTRLWPQIRKEILILPNLWTILHKMMEFRVRWQRRSPRGSEDVWVISEGAEWSVPSESWSLGLTAHSTSFCRRTPKGKSQTQFHGLLSWPSNSPARGREHLTAVLQGKRHCSPRRSNTSISGNMEPFLPMKAWIFCWNLETLEKVPKEPAQIEGCPWSHPPQRFYQVAAVSVFLVDIFRKAPRDLMKHIRKHWDVCLSCTSQRGIHI